MIILRETLTAEQSERCKTLYDRFARYLPSWRSFEEWEVSFLEEGNVDRELGIYESLADAFDRSQPKDTERTATAVMLLALSLGSKVRPLGLSSRVRARVEDAWRITLQERQARGLGHTLVRERPLTPEEVEAVVRLNGIDAILRLDGIADGRPVRQSPDAPDGQHKVNPNWN